MAEQMVFDFDTRTLDRFPGYFFKADGRVFSERRGQRREIYPTHTERYDVISLSMERGKQKAHSLHAVICEAFHGPKPAGMECRHLDGNRRNNRASNLCWGTHSQNQIDMREHGTAYRGERHFKTKLTEEEVIAVRAMASIYREKDVAAMFAISQSAVKHIKHRRSWKHV